MAERNSSLRLAVTAPLRLARSRGFGVHSPFAFRFITDVIRPRYRFYACNDVRRLARGTSTPAKLLQLLFRVAVSFDVRSAACFGPGRKHFERTLLLTRSDIALGAADPQLVVADGRADGLAEAISACIRAEGTVVISRLHSRRCPMAAVWDDALRRLGPDHGMSFTNGRTGIIVARAHLPRQNFKVWI